MLQTLYGVPKRALDWHGLGLGTSRRNRGMERNGKDGKGKEKKGKDMNMVRKRTEIEDNCARVGRKV